MEELYSETYLKAKPSTKRTAARIALIVLCVALVLVDIFILHSPFGLFLVVIIDGLIIYFLPTKNVAYEYIFVDGQIDFDCIVGGEKRKHQKRIDLDKVDIVAPETSNSLYQFRNLPMNDYSTGNPQDKHFIAVVRGEKNQERVKFTPDEKMIENMKMKGRSKIEY